MQTATAEEGESRDRVSAELDKIRAEMIEEMQRALESFDEEREWAWRCRISAADSNQLVRKVQAVVEELEERMKMSERKLGRHLLLLEQVIHTDDRSSRCVKSAFQGLKVTQSTITAHQKDERS
jgi:DNA-binding transcriptional ArsR family regulator